MSLMDNVKARLGPARDKVADLAHQHEGSVQNVLDRAAKTADKRTGGKYGDRIQQGTGKAKDAMGRLARKSGSGPDGGDATPPAGPSSAR